MEWDDRLGEEEDMIRMLRIVCVDQDCLLVRNDSRIRFVI